MWAGRDRRLQPRLKALRATKASAWQPTRGLGCGEWDACGWPQMWPNVWPQWPVLAAMCISGAMTAHGEHIPAVNIAGFFRF
jgi:hypothetical protein